MKHTRTLFKSKSDISTSKHLDLLHIDLSRPVLPSSLSGKLDCLVIVDNYSQFTFSGTKMRYLRSLPRCAKRLHMNYGKEEDQMLNTSKYLNGSVLFWIARIIWESLIWKQLKEFSLGLHKKVRPMLTNKKSLLVEESIF